MFWLLGHAADFSLSTPKSCSAGGVERFKRWMEDRGWRFDDYALDPLSRDYSVWHITGPDKLYSRWNEDADLWETQVNLPYHLLSLYEQRGLVNGGRPLPLYDYCAFGPNCWQGIDDRKPTDADNQHWSFISLPWIGTRYPTFRIVVLGINPNEAGGLDFYPQLIPEAQTELRAGRVRVNFGHKGYRGTLLWHRLGRYALTMVNELTEREDILASSPLETPDAYDWLAFTNSIKCSPVGERSSPTVPMWEHCSSLLKQELAVLQPKLILVVGTSDNLHYLKHTTLGSEVKLLDSEGRTSIHTGVLNGQRIGIVNVPHPASPRGGAAKAIEESLSRMLERQALRLKDILNLPRPIL